MNLTEEDINQVEQYVRDEGLERLEKQLKKKIDQTADFLLYEDQCTDTFGESHAMDPANFRFEIGDKKLIRFLRDHLIKNKDEKGVKYLRRFRKKKNVVGRKKMDMAKHVSGKSKVQNPIDSSITNSVVDDDDGDPDGQCQELRAQLFQNLNKYLKSFAIDEAVLQKFSLNNVSVSIVDGAINGEVYCFVCENEQNARIKKRKTTGKKVHCVVTGNTRSWVCSNFGKHLKNSHKMQQSQQTEETSLCQLDSNGGENLSVSSNYSKQAIESINHSDDQHDEKFALEKNFTIEFVDVPVDQSSSKSNNENILFQQVSTQIRKMFEATVSNEDDTEKVFYNLLEPDSLCLNVALIPKDGDCLFRSIVHQLHCQKIRSDEQYNATQCLRRSVVEHITKNYSRYEPALKNRVYELKPLDEIANMDKERKHILKNCLPRRSYWGGFETLMAVTEMYNVNILVFNEHGVCYFINGFNQAFTRTLLLAYRLKNTDSNDESENENDELRNHYDSICDLPSADIWIVLQFLSDTLVKQNSMNDVTL